MSANFTNGNETTIYITAERIPYGSNLFWIYLGVYVALALCAGLYAGLTIGILSLDPLTLKVVSESGATEKQRKRAKKLLPLVQRHHLVLVSLVLANAAAVEAMPVFLNAVTNEIVAILVSVTVVLFMGEILPQAICTKYGLAIGSCMTPLIYFTIFIFFPLTYPISKLLDFCLGQDHHTFYRRQELKALVAMHGPPKDKNLRINGGCQNGGARQGTPSVSSRANLLAPSSEDGAVVDYRPVGDDEGDFSADEGDVPLTRDEVMVIEGVLNLKEKTVAAAMVDFDQVFMLGMDSVLDFKVFDKILKEGFSRIPIYEGTKQNVKKILLVKTLITVNPEDRITVRNLLMRAEFHAVNAAFVNVERSLSDVLNDFKAARAGHLSIVYKDRVEVGDVGDDDDFGATREVVGIVTLEDVIEEMLQVEIYDEFDNIPRMPSIPGYLHYRKVHRVHSHWEPGDGGSLIESLEASERQLNGDGDGDGTAAALAAARRSAASVTQSSSSSHYTRHLLQPHHQHRLNRNRRPKFRRQASAGHVEGLTAHSPDTFRRKYGASPGKEAGMLVDVSGGVGSSVGSHRPQLLVSPAEFYLTDPDSSGSEFAPGSVSSLVGREMETTAVAFPAGPFVVNRAAVNEQLGPVFVVVADGHGHAHAHPPQPSPRQQHGGGQQQGYFQPVMDVLGGDGGGGSATAKSNGTAATAAGNGSPHQRTVIVHEENVGSGSGGDGKSCDEKTPLLKQK